MLSEYVPILMFIMVGLSMGTMLIVMGLLLGKILGHAKPYKEKLSSYECGFDAFEDAHVPFDVRYYLVAILFVLFDLEIAFLFPLAVVLGDIGASVFWAMIMFLLILVVGFIYEWKQGALEWE